MTFLGKYLVYGLITLNFTYTTWHIASVLQQHLRNAKGHMAIASDIARDDNFPQLPVGALDSVAMTFHESIHFTLGDWNNSVTNAEWVSLAAHPNGFGRVRLGPDHRLFVLTFYHQLHCIWKFQSALLNRDDPAASPPHILHCLNYLRQTFLCEAADTLEPGDFMERDFEVDRVGNTAVCRDWEAVYKFMDDAYDQWSEWQAHWN